jgi:hypothetical protein
VARALVRESAEGLAHGLRWQQKEGGRQLTGGPGVAAREGGRQVGPKENKIARFLLYLF